MPHEDLVTAWEAIEAKTPLQTRLLNYYDGIQDVAYPRSQIADLFRGQAWDFSQNWCAVVADAALDRLNLRDFEHEDEGIQARIQELWESNELSLVSDDVHELAVVVGEAYLLVWPDENGEPEAYVNDPRMCHVEYDPEHPRRMLWAAKRWRDDDDHLRMTLYYPDRLEYYVSRRASTEQRHGVGGRTDVSTGDIAGPKSMVPADPPDAPNPYGQVPVFHFRTHRRCLKSDLEDVLPLQDIVNKLLTDMMTAAEYGAFPMRYIICSMDIDPTQMVVKPNGIWHLAPGEGETASVGQFNATDLNNYLAALESVTGTIGVISRTPKHYFYKDAGTSLSGEALIALEAPLNKRVARHVGALSTTWKQAMAFMLKIAGVPADSLVMLHPNYDEPATVQPRTSAEITSLRVTAGVPLLAALRLEGLDDAEVAMIEAALEEERANIPTLGEEFVPVLPQDIEEDETE